MKFKIVILNPIFIENTSYQTLSQIAPLFFYELSILRQLQEGLLNSGLLKCPSERFLSFLNPAKGKLQKAEKKYFSVGYMYIYKRQNWNMKCRNKGKMPSSNATYQIS